ncbi:MAG: N-acetylmuramyl-L-alanine amidase, negative regulator of AmpC, AmpD [Chlorobi bacterium]|nr:N-acetylmuramyl-L-alanine amidase, negative regulator of AmpC, AmpD [Chlorobiota bacterium]
MNRRYSLPAHATLPIMLAVALIGLCNVAHAQPASVVRALLDDAAARFDIPRPLLYGIAYAESRWTDGPADSLNGSCTGMPRAVGVMGLRDDRWFGHSLRAGIPYGITPEEAATSTEKNIATGARYLSSLFSGTDRRDLREWIPAVERYSGIPESQEPLRMLHVDGVFELIRRGWGAGDVTVAAQPTPDLDREAIASGLRAMGMSAAGDYSRADWQPSPNFSSRDGSAITAIAIHDTEGSFAASLSWLQSSESQASAHYMIRSVDGFIVQMVREADKAWHVRNENPYTIGIEHEGFVDRPEFFTDAMYNSSAALTRYLIGKYNIPLDRTHVKGHIDFPNNTHTDPGGWWNWPRYYRLVSDDPHRNVVVDPFEDNVVGWWGPSMSGSTTGVDTGATTFAITPDAARAGKNGGGLRYAFTGADGGVVRVFRGGHGNTSDGLLNLGSDGFIGLSVRGDNDRNDLEFWLYDSLKNNQILRYGPINWTGWRTISMPLALLSGHPPYRFNSIVIRQNGGGRSGTLAFDDLMHSINNPAGVDDDPPSREPLGLHDRIAVASADPFPASLRDVGPVAIYSSAGEKIDDFNRLPDAAVGSVLRPGVYALRHGNRTIMLMVAP